MTLLLRNIFLVLTLCLGGVASAASELDKTPAEKDFKNSVWSLSLSGLYYNLKDDSGKKNEVIGPSGVVQLGLGGLFSQAFAFVSLDIMLGPYQSVRSEAIKTDFSGTGISSWAGYNLSPGDLRKHTLSFGISAGVGYADLVGRSIGQSASNHSNEYLDNYVIRLSNLSVYPGIFFAWLQPPRLEGNLPELLITRIEGYVINLAIGYPVQASYRATFDYKSEDPATPNEKRQERGRFEGMTFLLSFIPILGI